MPAERASQAAITGTLVGGQPGGAWDGRITLLSGRRVEFRKALLAATSIGVLADSDPATLALMYRVASGLPVEPSDPSLTALRAGSYVDRAGRLRDEYREVVLAGYDPARGWSPPYAPADEREATALRNSDAAAAQAYADLGWQVVRSRGAPPALGR